MSTASKSTHRFRDNVDAFAIAILMAILMKFFAIEAYQIPTSSMQPTMMGSQSAGVYDRILVDKTHYLLTDPERWDIAVFRYPIRTKQNYVKRIVGVPGDKLRIGGGNIYSVAGDDPEQADALHSLPRPAAVQEGHWKEIFPARLALTSQSTALGKALRGSGGEWAEADGTFRATPRNDRSRVALRYPGPSDDGLRNLVWDGYPTWIAQRMMEAGPGPSDEAVQDARISFAVSPGKTPDEFAIRLDVKPHTGPRYQFALVAEAGKGRIVVEQDGNEAAASEPFELPLGAGETTELRFSHLDDWCFAEVDGELLASLDCAAFKTLRPIFPRSDSDAGVLLRIEARGSGEIEIADLRIERDLHYLPSTSSMRDGVVEMIEVPEGHFFMMGDNTLQSVDSRDWTAITLGVSEDGKLVDPTKDPSAKKLVGNMRAISLSESPDPDENPVIVAEKKRIVFTDDIGEVHVLEGEVAMQAAGGQVWGPASLWFVGDDGYWKPEQHKVSFVRRDHILGRPLATFWPMFSPFRLGLIR